MVSLHTKQQQRQKIYEVGVKKDARRLCGKYWGPGQRMNRLIRNIQEEKKRYQTRAKRNGHSFHFSRQQARKSIIIIEDGLRKRAEEIRTVSIKDPITRSMRADRRQVTKGWVYCSNTKCVDD